MPKRLLKLLLILIGLTSLNSYFSAQEDWSITQQCVEQTSEPAQGFPGTIFTYEPETGIRAVRSDMTTSYIVAFEGANFTGAAAISPDGQWIAVPSGYISGETMVDQTYLINEIRVQSTSPSTMQITNRIPWRASYRGSERDISIRDIHWLNNEYLIYAHDNWEIDPADTEVLRINAFSGETETITSPIMAQLHTGLSPDGSRAFGLIDHRIALVDVETSAILADFTQPRSHWTAWSPDSNIIAIRRTLAQGDKLIHQLGLVDRDGSVADTVETADVLDMVFAPNSDNFALMVYDDEQAEPLLYLGKMSRRTLVNTCLSIRAGDDYTGHGMMWSPDSLTLAVMLNRDLPLRLIGLDSMTLHSITTFVESGPSYLIAWRDVP